MSTERGSEGKASGRGGKEVVLEQCTGTVKWFSLRQGYGFITRADNGEDVFVHRKSIPFKYANKAHVSRSLGKGEPVVFRIVKGPKGLEAKGISGPDGARLKGAENAIAKADVPRLIEEGKMRPRKKRTEDKTKKGDEEEKEEKEEAEEKGAAEDRHHSGRRYRHRRSGAKTDAAVALTADSEK